MDGRVFGPENDGSAREEEDQPQQEDSCGEPHCGECRGLWRDRVVERKVAESVEK